MITTTDADKLRAMVADEPAVLSVYLRIPLDLAEHRGLPVRARELIKTAVNEMPEACGARVREADLEAISRTVAERSAEWLGHTVAIFACAGLGLLETVPLPGWLTEQAVVAARPYTRPMLAAMQRNPAYRTALIDTKHAWIFSVTGDQIQTVAQRTGEVVPSTGFAGWDGLEGYRIQQRIMTLSRQHFRDTVAILERTADGEHSPLVLGGHESEISQFLSALPRAVRQTVAGSFNVDLQIMTPGRVRELSAPVIASWEERSEAGVVHEVLNEPPDTSVTTDLAGCLAASRARAVAQLILADDQMVPGYACRECGALGVGAGRCDCADPAECCRAVPDVLDELASQTLDDGGQVTAVRNSPFTVAARLRFAVPAMASTRRLP